MDSPVHSLVDNPVDLTPDPVPAVSRETRIARFLAASGWQDATATAIPGDASNRRYLRLVRGAARAVLMDAPPERGEDVRPFARATALLRARGLSAPEILAADAEAGLLLLEDLGDALFARVCAERPADEPALYAAAVDLLATHAAPAPDLPPYLAGVLEREARLATEWYIAAPADLADEYAAILGAALAEAAAERSVLVMRDYHAENLLWLPERTGAARVGLLDYQDALAGHPAYDLVSLLEDARRDTAPALREAMLARYLAARPDLDPDGFRAAYAALGAQRNLKIVGIFARLCLRDAKPRYLGLIPRVWSHLTGDLAHPALGDLRRFVAAHLPPPEPALLERLGAAAGSRDA